MKNKLVLTILSIGLVLAVTACGTTSSNSEDDTSLVTEMGVSGTEDSALETEITESSDADDSETVDATEEAAATEEAEATEVSDATEAVEGTESVDSTEDSDADETSDDSEAESEEEIPDISEITVESEDDGILLLKAFFGTEDSETGNKYVFIYLNTVTVNDVEYYAYTWSWAVDDHYSRLTDVFVSLDGSSIYEGDYDAEDCVFNSDNMLDE